MSKERFLRKLKENLTALQVSGQAYDLGLDGEAVRLAAPLRVLFHCNPKTGNVSLTKHLKIETWEMFSSDAQQGDPKGYVSFKIDPASSTPVIALSKLGARFFPIPMSQWWEGQPIYRFQNREYFRCNLVCSAANKDGACHVDSNLDKFYEDMESGRQLPILNGQNLVYPNNRAPYDQMKPQHCHNVHLAMLRQFAHEVLSTASHYRWLEKLSAK